MSHRKKNADRHRSKMYSDFGVPERDLPPTSEDRPWCTNTSYVFAYERKKARCGDCGKRLLLREEHCVGGELIGHRFPPHKVKIKTRKKFKGK